MTLPAHTWVKTPGELDALGQQALDAPWLALDTESNSMFVYRERVCLLQLNLGGEIFLVDTLALPDTRTVLDPLREAIEDPARPLYLHGGEYDVSVLKRDYDLAPQGIFDTQVAARYLGLDKTGYGALVEIFCDVPLAKAHTQYNWGRRPIDKDAIRYALDDVYYLPDVVHTIEGIVTEADRLEEVRLAFTAVRDAAPHPAGFDPAKMYKLKDLRKLDRQAFGVLTALYKWRDDLAREADRPPARFLANAVLVQLARRAPTTRKALSRLRLKRWFVDTHADGLLRTIDAALKDPPAPPPRPPARVDSGGARKREAKLKSWRRDEAKRRGVPLPVVLPNAAIQHLKQHGAADLGSVPLLGGKRIALYGDVIADIVAP